MFKAPHTRTDEKEVNALRDNGGLLLLMKDDDIVGLISCGCKDDVAELTLLFILVEHRGNGNGKALVEAAEDIARRN